jgi:hypothetical protein
MQLPGARYWSFLILSTLTAVRTEAQSPLKDSLITDSAYAAAVREYHAYVAPEVGLYRGTQYYFDNKLSIRQGQPFLGPDVMRVGSVWYGGIEYDDLAMEYNLVKEQLVILDPSNDFKISIYMDLVDSFALDGYVYFRLRDKAAPSILRSGYCDRIHQGRFVLLKRDHKSIVNTVISLNNPLYVIEENIHYYILKNGVYHAVDTKSKLLHALRDRRRSEIRKVMRESGLEWSTDKEKILLLVAAWYDTLIR